MLLRNKRLNGNEYETFYPWINLLETVEGKLAYMSLTNTSIIVTGSVKTRHNRVFFEFLFIEYS